MRELDRLGRADWHAVDRVISAVLGVPEAELPRAVTELDRIYLADPWVPVAGAAATMARLEACGKALGIVSNATGTMEQMLLEHRICGVAGEDEPEAAVPRVSVIVDSHVVGVEKPDPRIFAIALAVLDLPPERCAYVGDTVHFDVGGARAAGLHAIHLDPYRLCPDRDHDHLTTLSELVAAPE
jgi:putative hydrolase of the HAD superfamily